MDGNKRITNMDGSQWLGLQFKKKISKVKLRSICNELITKNSPNVRKFLKIQEDQQIPNGVNSQKFTLRNKQPNF